MEIKRKREKKEGGKSRLKETETERVTRRQEKKTNEYKSEKGQ